jgi:hypothetical protein
MKRRILAAMLTLGLASQAHAATNLNVSLQIGTPPPAPVIVSEPHVMLVPGTTVWVVRESWDYDCFRSGGWWFAWRSGHWYRARHWRGPFAYCETRYVPVAVTRVPERHWKHHWKAVPPGHARKMHNQAASSRGHGPELSPSKKHGKH